MQECDGTLGQDEIFPSWTLRHLAELLTQLFTNLHLIRDEARYLYVQELHLYREKHLFVYNYSLANLGRHSVGFQTLVKNQTSRYNRF